MPDAPPAAPYVPHQKYERLIAAAKARPAIVTAVVLPCDPVSLGSAVEAARLGLIVPVLVAPPARLREIVARARAEVDALAEERPTSPTGARQRSTLPVCGR